MGVPSGGLVGEYLQSRTIIGAALIVVLALAAGCATSELSGSSGLGTQCVDDSADCIGKRQSALRSMMADNSRAWVREPVDAKAYASGVRLFAYRGKRKELTCEELAHGKREADAAQGALQGPSTGLTPAQISRGTMLAAEVSKELNSELVRRCHKG